MLRLVLEPKKEINQLLANFLKCLHKIIASYDIFGYSYAYRGSTHLSSLNQHYKI